MGLLRYCDVETKFVNIISITSCFRVRSTVSTENLQNKFCVLLR